jgi:hypothetical protein
MSTKPVNVEDYRILAQRRLARQRRPILRVDLTGVTFIDAAGQACLAAMLRQGAEFLAADCLTKAVVAEVTREQAGPAQGDKHQEKQ